jgi:hypothetical protein
VLGLRYVACERCETVYAVPAEPPTCRRCGAATLVDVTDRLRDGAYFVDVGRDG